MPTFESRFARGQWVKTKQGGVHAQPQQISAVTFDEHGSCYRLGDDAREYREGELSPATAPRGAYPKAVGGMLVYTGASVPFPAGPLRDRVRRLELCVGLLVQASGAVELPRELAEIVSELRPYYGDNGEVWLEAPAGRP